MKRFFFGIFTLLFSILLAYGAGEILVYSLFRKEIALFPRYVTGAQYGDFQIRRNVPNHTYRHKSYDGEWTFKINSQGFRSEREFPYEKNAATVRILVLGDSYTLGYEVKSEETYSSVLEKELKARGFSAEVINTGVSGFSNAEELIFLEQEGLKFHPDFVVLGFYVNDLSDNVRADLFRIKEGKLVFNKKEYLPAIQQRNFLHSLPVYSWLSEHSYLHNYLNQAATLYFKHKMEDENMEKILRENGISSGPEGTAAYEAALASALLNRIHKAAQANDAYFILLDIPAYDTFLRSLPGSIDPKTVSDSFVDSREILEPHRSEGFLYRPHAQRHWTEIAHVAAGKALADTVEAELKRRKNPV